MTHKNHRRTNPHSEGFYLCSFSDSRYVASRKRIEKQALKFDVFDSISLYNEADLSDSFISDFKTELSTDVPGFGYWVWKPWVILETLKKMSDNDVLLYVDMGCHLKIGGRERLLSYREEVMQNSSGFLVSQLDKDKLERIWTKGDLLDHFQVRNQPEIIDTPQYQAGIIFIRKTTQTVAVIQSWLDVFHNHFNLIDRSASISPNEDGFLENRHDQSVLSLLLKKHGTSVIPFNEVYSLKWDKSTHKYPIHIRRDLSMGFWSTLIKKLKRLHGKPKRLLERRRLHSLTKKS